VEYFQRGFEFNLSSNYIIIVMLCIYNVTFAIVLNNNNFDFRIDLLIIALPITNENNSILFAYALNEE
jgi:hypothetical protein